MKQIVYALLAVVASVFLSPVFGAETIVLKRGIATDIWLSWPAGAALDDARYIDVFPEFRQEYRGGEFKLARAAGFDFIRLTIDPAIFLSKRRPDKTAKLLGGVRAAIADIRAAGLKVDLDMHTIPRDSKDPGTDQLLADAKLFETYLEVVADVAGVAAEYPADDVAFEVLNEPTIDCAYALNGAKPRWPAMLQRLHAVARKAAPKTTLVLSGACWGGAEGLSALSAAAFDDDNIIWSFHSYDPFIFSHQGASWTEDVVGYVSGLAFPPKAGTRARIAKTAERRITAARISADRKVNLINALRDNLKRYYEAGAAVADAKAPFAAVATWAKKNGVPPARIMLGEFGVIRGDSFASMPDTARAELIRVIRSEAEARGFAWSVWSWGGSFGMTATPETRAFSPVLLKALGLKPQ